MAALARGATDGLAELEEGDGVLLWPAPQGGYALMFGARVYGVDSVQLAVDAVLSRPEEGTAVAQGERMMPMVETANGVLETDASAVGHFVHLLPCPNLTAEPISDRPLLLSLVAAVPGSGGTLSAQQTIRPACAPDPSGDLCRCECDPGYYAGKCAGPAAN